MQLPALIKSITKSGDRAIHHCIVADVPRHVYKCSKQFQHFIQSNV